MSAGPELVHVPTADELVANGLASRVISGGRAAVHITELGNAMLSDAMLENGRRLRAWDESHPSAATLARREREAARVRARSWAEDAFAE